MLNPDYAEILSIFQESEVAYLLVGAYAMAVHGYPRATADIDIWVKPDPDNAKRVIIALQAFGTPLEDVSAEDFAVPGIVFQIGVAPRRIDILTKVDGLTFEEAYRSKEIVQIEGIKVPVITREALIQNKLATGRERDRLDAAELQKNQV